MMILKMAVNVNILKIVGKLNLNFETNGAII